MGVPQERMRRSEVVVVGLNPGGGGDRDSSEHRQTWDTPVSSAHPTGNVYFEEKWEAEDELFPVQKQVQAWHRMIGIGPTESFCAFFVPFRSPDWNRLGNRRDAMAIGRRLWRWVVAETPARLFPTMGKVAGRELAALMKANMLDRSLPTGWGRQTIDVWKMPDERRIVALPHPSRYQLFGRFDRRSDKAEASFRAATGPFCGSGGSAA